MDRWLVVGLGNPGDQYRDTRHNVGQQVIEYWAGDRGVSLARVKSFGQVANLPGSPPVVLAVPSGYMNTSGGPVSQLCRYFSIPLERVVVIHDDLDLPAGVIRLKKGGGHGGHNGLRDIQKALGGADFYRVRIGIGRPPGQMDPAAYVLKPFQAAEKKELPLWWVKASDATEALINRGLLEAQQLFHAPDASGDRA